MLKFNLKKYSNKKDDFEKMNKWFNERTKKHIKLVKSFCKKIFDYDKNKFDGLMKQVKNHDQSKFKNPELDPYINTTWVYKCKEDGTTFNVSEDMQKKMDEATEHHIKNNRHHPEYHDKRKTNLINKNNRDDVPDKMVDGTQMDDLDIAEMVADWLAVSEERNSSVKQWADKNVNKRWKFKNEQKELIYELIDNISSITTTIKVEACNYRQDDDATMG